MAALIPTFQYFEHVKVGGNSFGIHKVILASASDTVTVPTLAHTTPSNAVVELDDSNNDTGVAVAASDANTVTLIGGAAGGVVWFMTRHRGRINYVAEA